jgi:hypothetical protein
MSLIKLRAEKAPKNNLAFDFDLSDKFRLVFNIGGIEFSSSKMSFTEADVMEKALNGLLSQTCQHPKIMPAFDDEAAEGLSSDEVRDRWPRFSGSCPDCDFNGVMYASFAHYISGDW